MSRHNGPYITVQSGTVCSSCMVNGTTVSKYLLHLSTTTAAAACCITLLIIIMRRMITHNIIALFPDDSERGHKAGYNENASRWEETKASSSWYEIVRGVELR